MYVYNNYNNFQNKSNSIRVLIMTCFISPLGWTVLGQLPDTAYRHYFSLSVLCPRTPQHHEPGIEPLTLGSCRLIQNNWLDQLLKITHVQGIMFSFK